jgi:hypothetical protein
MQSEGESRRYCRFEWSSAFQPGCNEEGEKWIAYFISRHKAGGKILVPKTSGLKRGN